MGISTSTGTSLRRLVSIACLAVVMCVLQQRSSVSGQSNKEIATFEVASVRRVGSDDGTITAGFEPGRFVSRGTLRMIVQVAYDLREEQLVGGPSWFGRDYFEIIATTPGVTGRDETKRMLQALLAERFKLVVHTETKTLQSLDLMTVKGRGLGTLIRDSAVDCAALGEKPAPVPPSSKLWCGLRGTGPGRITGQGATIAQFATLLSAMAGRLVVDETGMAGRYDLEFVWKPHETANDTGPSLATALEDQLGLRLSSNRRPVKVTVVDHAESPSEN